MKAIKLATFIFATLILATGCDNGGKKRGTSTPNYGYNYGQYCDPNTVIYNAQTGQYTDRTTGAVRVECSQNYNQQNCGGFNNGGYNQGYNQGANSQICYRNVGTHWVDINGRPVQGVNCNLCTSQYNQQQYPNGLYPTSIADECTITYGQGSYRVVVNGRLYCSDPYMYRRVYNSGSPYIYGYGMGSRCRYGRALGGLVWGYICS